MRSSTAALSPIAGAFEPRDHLGRDVETARLEHERHHRQPRQQVVRRCRRRFPQPVMGRQIAIDRTERREAVRQEREMLGLLGGDRDPIVEKRARQPVADRTVRSGPRRDRSHSARYAPARARARSAPPASRNCAASACRAANAERDARPRRARRRIGISNHKIAAPPCFGNLPAQRNLGGRLGGGQHRHRPCRERPRPPRRGRGKGIMRHRHRRVRRSYIGHRAIEVSVRRNRSRVGPQAS